MLTYDVDTQCLVDGKVDVRLLLQRGQDPERGEETSQSTRGFNTRAIRELL